MTLPCLRPLRGNVLSCIYLLAALGGFSAAAQTLHFEAEMGQLEGPSLKVMPDKPADAGAHADYSGTGYVTGFNQPTDHLVFKFKVKHPGIYILSLTYRTEHARGFDIDVNDDGATGMMPPTSGNQFATVSAGRVELVEGQNVITINRGWGYFDLDYIELKPTPAPVPPLPVSTPPVDPQSTPEARALLAKLDASYGKTTGVGVYKDADADYVVAKVGLRPSVMGGDLLGYSPYFQKHSPKKDDEIARLIADYLSGQMITLSWHWGSPFGGLDTKEKPWWRAFYTDSTTFDVSKAVIPGTPEHDAAISDIDVIAIQLKRLQDAHVPVLWRPLHEAQGAWFWWGAKGPAPFKALWAMLYDRLVHVDGIHNLIWVFTSGDDPAWYPGDAMVDIVGIDAYPKNMHDAENSLWVELQQQFDGRKPLAILEFGGVPDIPRMQHLGEYWLYAVSWSDKLGPAKNDPADLVRIYTNPGVSALPTAATPPPAAAPATSAPSQRMQ